MARRLPLVHDESAHAGLLMVRAVYTTTASDAPSETVEDVFQGWVIAPFGAQDALEGVTRNFGTEYQLTIYQGTEAAVDRVMFTSKERWSLFFDQFAAQLRWIRVSCQAAILMGSVLLA